MHKGLAVLILALAALSCPVHAQQGLPTWRESAQKDWWAKNPTPDTWPKAADDLQAQLEAVYKANGARVFADSDFRNWMEHLQWIRLGLTYSGEISDPKNLQTFIALGQDDSISHLFVEKLDPMDHPRKALQNLFTLSQGNPADLHEYAALGVAFALVWDQPFPANWPHHQVDPQAVPLGDNDVLQRFQFYVHANRDKKLDLDLTTMSEENLKFLVDSEVKLSELVYAQKNRVSYTTFQDAYFSIKYDTDRVSSSSSVYDWPGPSYMLADIEKAGGICIDQAYYAEILGKGRGIPTIVFTGYGMDGAHAWFGYLSNSGKWELDCGRYETQDFPKGFAVDPQTWQKIDDSTLQNFFKSNGMKNPNYQATITALTWAFMHKDDATIYAHILDDAMSIMPEWSGTWRLQADLIEKGSDVDKKKKFYQDWIRQFSTYPEMKVEGQKRLYLALKKANDPDADGLLKDIIIQNRSVGFDLGIEASANVMKEKLDAEDWGQARTAYERAIRDFGQQGGLTLFHRIVEPYVEFCLEHNKADMADKAMAFAEDRMSIDMTSQVGQYFKLLKGQVFDAKQAAK